MDPYSSEGELVNIHTAFHQSQYQAVIDFDTSSFSSSNALPVRVLQARAQLALGQFDTVLSSIPASEAKSVPDLAAVRALATYLQSPSETSSAISEAQKLASAHGSDNLTVQLLCGSVLASAGQNEEALALLQKHQGSLDAVALIVQIHLSMNRADLAAKEARSARSFAQDALLVNLAEAWVGMREGGDKYQQSFYVFEEMAQAPSTQSANALTAQAVSELHLGRLPEAETALQQVTQLDADNADGLANQIVLNSLLGKTDEVKQTLDKLQSVQSQHVLLEELAAKREAFQAASAKYNPKFEP